MFEKEAEEYLEELRQKKIPFDIYEVNNQLKLAFIAGLNKANEWHYVKDGKPKDNEYVLIYTDIKNVYIARLVEDDYFITNKGGFVQMSAVIAWKEIVFPKESE